MTPLSAHLVHNGESQLLEQKTRSIEKLMALRGGLFEFIAIALVVALGINLLVTGLVIWLDLPGWANVLLGVACCLLGISYFLGKVKPANSRQFKFRGVLPIRRGKERKVMEIERYEFSEKVKAYFQGMSAENKALDKAWRESPLGYGTTIGTADKLLLEAIEYFVLEQLSLHLSAYFENNDEIDDAQITRFKREDVPGILLQNRFLELFSKPMEQREPFIDYSDALIKDDSICYATGKGGAVFDDFELILPSGTVVTRSEAEGLEIKTSRFHLRIKPEFEGFSHGLTERFAKLYMGVNFDEVSAYRVGITIDVKFKLTALLSVAGWEYYKWLDSFLDIIESEFSFDHFVHEIGWPTALSTATAISHQKNNSEPKAG